MIKRKLIDTIKKRLKSNKIIIILGPRQVGKTTLLKELKPFIGKYIIVDGDEADVVNIFKNATSTNIKAAFGNYNTLFIDEAQKIDNIGNALKLIADKIPELKVIVTGSSSLDISNRMQESLTGRKWEYNLYPLSFSEMVQHHGLLEEKRMLNRRLIYGYYPEVVSNPGDEIEILKNLVNSYLYKDVLVLDGIKKSKGLIDICDSLAKRVGKEISLTSLARDVQLDYKTVDNYLEVLEKAYIIFRLPPYHRSIGKAIRKSRKIIFYDNGVVNALLNNFNPPEKRIEIGGLWENFIIAERLKYLHYNKLYRKMYFLRIGETQELDLIEEADGTFYAHEFAWKEDKKMKKYDFAKKYLNINEIKLVNSKNYDAFLL